MSTEIEKLRADVARLHRDFNTAINAYNGAKEWGETLSKELKVMIAESVELNNEIANARAEILRVKLENEDLKNKLAWASLR